MPALIFEAEETLVPRPRTPGLESIYRIHEYAQAGFTPPDQAP